MVLTIKEISVKELGKFVNNYNLLKEEPRENG